VNKRDVRRAALLTALLDWAQGEDHARSRSVAAETTLRLRARLRKILAARQHDPGKELPR